MGVVPAGTGFNSLAVYRSRLVQPIKSNQDLACGGIGRNVVGVIGQDRFERYPRLVGVTSAL